MSQRESLTNKKGKRGTDRGTVVRSYTVGEAVWICNFTQGPTWLEGVAVQNQGQCSLYYVKLSDYSSSSRPY